MGTSAAPPHAEEPADLEPEWDNFELLSAIIEDRREELRLTQSALAENLGINVRTYRNRLKDLSVLKVEQLEALAAALRMSLTQRGMIYTLTGHAPSRAYADELRSSPDLRKVLKPYKILVADQTLPSCIIDDCGNVLFANSALEYLFPGIKNTLWYTLFYPLAWRRLGGTPARFHHSWLIPALANFASQRQQRPYNPELRRLHRALMRHPKPEVATAYENIACWMGEHGAPFLDARERPFYHPDPKLGHIKVSTIQETLLQFGGAPIIHSTFVFQGVGQAAA